MLAGSSVRICFGHKRDRKRIRYMEKHDTISRLQEFLDDEARSCSMDFGCITPLYIYRMWGGRVAIEDIEAAFEELKRNNDLPFVR